MQSLKRGIISPFSCNTVYRFGLQYLYTFFGVNIKKYMGQESIKKHSYFILSNQLLKTTTSSYY